MAFIAEGEEGIGAVRATFPDSLVLYIENEGEFVLPLSVVTRVHDGKVILDPRSLPAALLQAVGHAHDGEDPSLVG
jgi:hypothetical protein